VKIAIFGSSGSSGGVGDDITDRRAVEDFCAELGAMLADFPHALLVESDSPATADRLVVEGLLKSPQGRKAKIWVYHRTRRWPSPPFAEHARALKEAFLFKPYSERRLAPLHLQMLHDSDLAIIIGGGQNSYAAGIAAAFMGVRLIPVASFGGAGRVLWQQFSDQFEAPRVKLPLRYTWDHLAGHPRRTVEVIRNEIATLPRLMIVHGRDNDRIQVQDILRKNGIDDPIVLQERLGPGQTIPEKFEREALQADGALVLFTPDDEAAAMLTPTGESISASERRKLARARQNVSMEYGWFWGKLGRSHVLLLLKGELELPSDLAGLLYESYVHSPDECEAAIVGFVDNLRRG
jgi:predicted nucleotide-binding protein